MKYSLRPQTLKILLLFTLIAALIRLFYSLYSWLEGSNTQIESYSFAVVFPSLLIFSLSKIGASSSKEGLLMRFGTMLQLLLIIAVPPLALYLALGLPMVFLVVELFSTKVPCTIRSPIESAIIQ